MGSVPVAVAEGVSVGEPESVSLAVIDAVSVGESVPVGLGVRDSVGVRVPVGVDVLVPVAVTVGVGGTKQISTEAAARHHENQFVHGPVRSRHRVLVPP